MDLNKEEIKEEELVPKISSIFQDIALLPEVSLIVNDTVRKVGDCTKASILKRNPFYKEDTEEIFKREELINDLDTEPSIIGTKYKNPVILLQRIETSEPQPTSESPVVAIESFEQVLARVKLGKIKDLTIAFKNAEKSHRMSTTKSSLIRSKIINKPYTCQVCFAQYKFRNIYENHMYCHVGVKLYGCHVCPAKYKWKTSLTRHLRIHTKKNPHACQFCPSTFKFRNTLSRHMSIHEI